MLLQISVALFVLALLAIALSNTRALRRLGDYAQPGRWPRISVLVPARNEEANIVPCLQSLLGQHYPDYEVLVLDDQSTDRTPDLLAGLQARYPRLRALAGAPIPPGWVGKNWACHQLAQAAQGELILFTDADTRHHAMMLADAAAAMEAERADLLSAIPRQEAVSWAERLVVPAITWSYCFMPFALAHRSSSPVLSITIGQFMLFRRRAYDKIGGYAAISGEVAEDTMLGRRTKEHGLRWRLLDGGERLSCRMYHNGREVFAGFSRALLAGFGSLPAYVLAWLWLALAFLEPPVVLLAYLAGGPIAGAVAGLAAAAVGGSLLLWGLAYRRFRFPLYLAALYPASIALAVAIAAYSAAITLFGRSDWKGRRVARQRVRLG